MNKIVIKKFILIFFMLKNWNPTKNQLFDEALKTFAVFANFGKLNYQIPILITMALKSSIKSELFSKIVTNVITIL